MSNGVEAPPLRKAQKRETSRGQQAEAADFCVESACRFASGGLGCRPPRPPPAQRAPALRASSGLAPWEDLSIGAPKMCWEVAAGPSQHEMQLPTQNNMIISIWGLGSTQS